jgi:choline dehydrogenase-like flavoprotein
MKKRVVVIGAGLCGSVLAAMLRNDFHVTVIEQGAKKKPLFTDVECATGELNTSINRAEGLGGTTNYWHNALIELDDKDLAKAGIEPGGLRRYYDKAWSFFLSPSELADVNRTGAANQAALAGGEATLAHMVLPQKRHNVWELANERLPGARIDVVYGHAEKIVPPTLTAAGYVQLAGSRRVEADIVLVTAGGIGTPVLLARSLGREQGMVPGYHDHPMAYVAKIKLKPDSQLKRVSSTATRWAEVRAGLIYETAGLKTVVYVRPAIDMRLQSITGPARYILSDLRNDPFSPKKIMMLLGNLEAVREAILFKTRSKFRGDYYSVLILGEQTPIATRGITMAGAKRPELNWHVTPDELASYDQSVQKFFAEYADDIVEKKLIPAPEWAFRNAAHHSGTANSFVAEPGRLGRDFFAVTDLPGTYVCDGSLLRAAGIANSGLTLVALAYRLAEEVAAAAQAKTSAA